MPMMAVWMKVDGGRIAQSLEEAHEKLETTEGDVVLDFCSVGRMDAESLKAMERFAAAAEQKKVKVALRGVNVDAYKVLKLVKLAPRFSFVN
jgi:anti-anti-sigma regulatory factor